MTKNLANVSWKYRCIRLKIRGGQLKFNFSEKATKICAIFLMVWKFTKCPNHEEDCAIFCGLLRKAELSYLYNLLNLQHGILKLWPCKTPSACSAVQRSSLKCSSECYSSISLMTTRDLTWWEKNLGGEEETVVLMCIYLPPCLGKLHLLQGLVPADPLELHNETFLWIYLLKLLVQMSHSKGFFPSWTDITCFYKLPLQQSFITYLTFE